MQSHRNAKLRIILPCWLVLLSILGVVSATWASPAETPPPQADTSTDSVNLRPVFDKWEVRARRQGTRGTCSVFTVAAATEYALGKAGKTGNCLSVEFLNWASNQTVGDPRDGSFFSDLWKGVEKYGVCDEKEMPYRDQFDPERRPPAAALAHAEQIHNTDLTLHWIKPWDPNKGLNEEQFLAIKATLRSGWPVCGGFLWPKQAEWIHPDRPEVTVRIPRRSQETETRSDPTVPDGSILQWAPRDRVRDGHSILIYGFRDDPNQPGGGVFLIRNSSRGARHGAMSYKYARDYMNDAVWVESKAP